MDKSLVVYCYSRTDALKLERKIKGRGITRYQKWRKDF